MYPARSGWGGFMLDGDRPAVATRPLSVAGTASRGKKAREPSTARLTVMLLAAAGGTRATNGASQGAGRGFNGSSTCAVDVFAERPVGRIDGRKRRLGNPIKKYIYLQRVLSLRLG
jgi:hypothetical protein